MKLSKMHIRVLKAHNPCRDIKINADFTAIEERIAEQVTEGHYGRYGWEGPNKADKGKRLGSCNITRCQRPGAYWYNSVMGAWYCSECAHEINYRPLPDGSYLCVRSREAYKEYHDGLGS